MKINELKKRKKENFLLEANKLVGTTVNKISKYNSEVIARLSEDIFKLSEKVLNEGEENE